MLALAIASCLFASGRDEAKASALLRDMREEQAIALLTKAIERDPEPPQRARLYVLLGIARLNLRDTDGAKLAFRRGRESDPDVELPADLASPRARELFEAERPVLAETAETASRPVPVRRVAGGAISALGAVAAVGGIVLQFRAGALRQAAEDEPVALHALELAADAQEMRTTSAIVLGTGLALITAGVLLMLWPEKSADTSVGVLIGPGQLGLTFAHAW